MLNQLYCVHTVNTILVISIICDLYKSITYWLFIQKNILYNYLVKWKSCRIFDFKIIIFSITTAL